MRERNFYEVLSPVGDKETFYRAIKSGADAVYMGLPKYNARMKAENITIDSLLDMITYAKLKGVKVYITLNTLLMSHEIEDIISLVGECLAKGVDAFIVQDMGLIYALKNTYPDIVLHGSTQMGVHNVRGAKVAKELGLSRIVLSREVTLEDIKEISENVDIELEVFIQGAMCIAFSGNCYLSSLKHGASGNRGECKQLCRLPYELANKKGYYLSPRDNCMLDYLSDLMELNVKSFKIEGRLRHSGYVSVSTSVYSRAMSDILSGKITNLDTYKSMLKRVFSRGEYTSGYMDTNDIINPIQNNHLGEEIGTVLSCNKFKDIYKITMKLNKQIHSGDGLKFVTNNDMVSLGVGNIERNGDKYIVYGKNYIRNTSKVYLSMDTEFENSIPDISKHIDLAFKFYGFVGNKARLVVEARGVSFEVLGEECQVPKSRPLTDENIATQLGKVDSDLFNIKDIQIDIEEIFLPLSAINELRRKAVLEITNSITRIKDTKTNKFTLEKDVSYPTYSTLAIVDENMDISKCRNYDALILSPKAYSIDTISKFAKSYKKYFTTPLIINLPIIARHKDIRILDEIVNTFSNEIFIANNIYALDYISEGVNVWAGAGLNISNDYAYVHYKILGVKDMVSSIEKWCPTLPGTYKITQGKMVLMTLTACPIKALNNCDCFDCKYRGNIVSSDGYTFRRYRIADCYWEVVDSKSNNTNYSTTISDLRGI